ncbi:hypothetical protein PVK06_041466 [Gossypium arboreum]|uniref:Uncharacterized protein n=1 Tax=Gossypium arboreum TaxID=29729 RepID=A0ABR0N8W8_GOSAR|nr:hypothetical protein PVK06_041466 [Gossypium arboreum]
MSDWGPDSRLQKEIREEGIITIWDKGRFVLGSHFCTKHFVVIESTWVDEGVATSLTNVYAPNGCSEQEKVWEEIGDSLWKRMLCGGR